MKMHLLLAAALISALANAQAQVQWDETWATGPLEAKYRLLPDGSQLKLFERSKVSLGRRGPEQVIVDLKYGRLQLKAVTQLQTEIRTNNAVCNVLEPGDFTVDAGNPAKTVITAHSGRLEVSDGTKKTVLLSGESVTVEAQQEHPGGLFKVGGGVTAPQLVHPLEPEYTPEAREANLEGTVVLYTVITAEGEVRDLRVIRPLGLGLDEKAMESVRQWKFRPGKKGDTPVAVAASIEVTFRLPDRVPGRRPD